MPFCAAESLPIYLYILFHINAEQVGTLKFKEHSHHIVIGHVELLRVIFTVGRPQMGCVYQGTKSCQKYQLVCTAYGTVCECLYHLIDHRLYNGREV